MTMSGTNHDLVRVVIRKEYVDGTAEVREWPASVAMALVRGFSHRSGPRNRPISSKLSAGAGRTAPDQITERV